MEIIYFFALVALLYVLLYITKQTENFINQKQCSREEINNAYKEYVFTSPFLLRKTN